MTEIRKFVELVAEATGEPAAQAILARWNEHVADMICQMACEGQIRLVRGTVLKAVIDVGEAEGNPVIKTNEELTVLCHEPSGYLVRTSTGRYDLIDIDTLGAAMVIERFPSPASSDEAGDLESNQALPGYQAWGSHPVYPRSDWEYEVSNEDTNLGYWQWVRHQIAAKETL